MNEYSTYVMCATKSTLDVTCMDLEVFLHGVCMLHVQLSTEGLYATCRLFVVAIVTVVSTIISVAYY